MVTRCRLRDLQHFCEYGMLDKLEWGVDFAHAWPDTRGIMNIAEMKGV